MEILVATDIHGCTNALRAQLSTLGEPIIASPWSGDGRPYANEQQAVAAFHENDGLSVYERKIAELVDGRAVFLIGFSVGATTLWRYVASAQCNPGCRAVLYYGSRIRDFVGLRPRCPTSLVFAEHEASFDPATIVPALARSDVDCTVMRGTRHGFMNPASPNYRADIARDQLERLSGAIRAMVLR